MNLYRIVEEALTNVRMHSGATLVEVVLRLAREKHIALEVRDDGQGSNVRERVPGMGILGMKERAVILGGILEVESGNSGTTVRAILPMEQVI